MEAQLSPLLARARATVGPAVVAQVEGQGQGQGRAEEAALATASGPIVVTSKPAAPAAAKSLLAPTPSKAAKVDDDDGAPIPTLEELRDFVEGQKGRKTEGAAAAASKSTPALHFVSNRDAPGGLAISMLEESIRRLEGLIEYNVSVCMQVIYNFKMQLSRCCRSRLATRRAWRSWSSASPTACCSCGTTGRRRRRRWRRASAARRSWPKRPRATLSCLGGHRLDLLLLLLLLLPITPLQADDD